MRHTPTMANDADDDLEAIADPVELASIRRALAGPETARSRRARIRFANHLLGRAPESMFARLMLAHVTDSREDRLGLLRAAVEIGKERWQPELDGENPEPRWTEGGAPRLFAACVVAYGTVLAKSGIMDEAAACFGLMTRLDPEDELGTVRMAELEGWPVDAAPGRRDHRPTR